MILLSILIPSLETRRKQLSVLLRELEAQCKPYKEQIEVLPYIDNKQATTGFKRQSLLERAKGKYIVFIDDDDRIYKRYIPEIIKGCNSECECISIEGLMTTDGKNPIRWKISKDFVDETVKVSGRNFYKRFTNHLAPVKREIALKSSFPDISNGEDSAYAKGLRGLLHSEYEIKGVLYQYNYISTQKEYK